MGHAIDMNVRTGGVLCDWDCLLNESRWSSGVSCFIGKVRDDSVLRWGGDFRDRDPVHIDDELNYRNPTLWDQLFNTMQANC